VRVMDDLPADVDRRAVQRERPLDYLDRPFHPGAVPTGRCEHQLPHHAVRVAPGRGHPVTD
jgi:hypothetical protein